MPKEMEMRWKGYKNGSAWPEQYVDGEWRELPKEVIPNPINPRNWKFWKRNAKES